MTDFQSKLKAVLRSYEFHTFILALILLDVFVLLGEFVVAAYKEFMMPEECLEAVSTELLEVLENKAFYYSTLIILCIFVLEIVLQVVVHGIKYFSKPSHILDAILIVGCLVLQIYLHHASSIVSLLMILRIIRLFKFSRHFVEFQEDEERDHIRKLEARIVELESMVSNNKLD
jgi:hypothetical protein